MKNSGGRLKFSHNKKVQGSNVHGEEGFWMRPRLHPHRPHEQEKRMSGLVSSGILGLFIKWDRIWSQSRERKMEGTEVIPDGPGGFQPQSMEDSNIYLIFIITAYFTGCSSLVFVFEVLWSCRLRVMSGWGPLLQYLLTCILNFGSSLIHTVLMLMRRVSQS